MRHKTPRAQPRAKEITAPHKIIYIYCEGKVTEPGYFSAVKSDLRLPSIQIKIFGGKGNRKSLVQYVRRNLKNNPGVVVGRDGSVDAGEYAVYVVFDVDAEGVPNPALVKEQACAAIAMCEKSGYKAIVSNDSFELWFVLHYDLVESLQHRSCLCDKVTDLMRTREDRPRFKYGKDGATVNLVCEKIADKRAVAIQNAATLCGRSGGSPVTAINAGEPYTNVHDFFENLEKFWQI